jgi:hypothetical protein
LLISFPVWLTIFGFSDQVPQSSSTQVAVSNDKFLVAFFLLGQEGFDFGKKISYMASGLTCLREMSWEVHRVMQDSDDLNAFGGGAVKDNMPAFVVSVRSLGQLMVLPSLRGILR